MQSTIHRLFTPVNARLHAGLTRECKYSAARAARLSVRRGVSRRPSAAVLVFLVSPACSRAFSGQVVR
jgi:hypothetical protein